jgi:4-amino-4-deoxy-L-arabinose transferase-like glycosyltransferase
VGKTAGQRGREVTRVSGSLALFALAIVGQLCALQLIDVKPYAFFQHYKPWMMLPREHPVATGVLAVQAAVVAALAWRLRGRLITAGAGVLPLRAWLIVAAGIGFSLAVPSVSVSFYAAETILAGVLAVLAALNFVLAALLIPEDLLSRTTAWVGARVTLVRVDAGVPRLWDRRLPFVLALWVTLMAATMNVLVLERVPHIDDSVSNLFQAKYFSTGQLTLPAPPNDEAFRMDLTVVRDGKWFGYAFPLWPAVLALGVIAGVPWLVNPILGGVLMLLGHAWLARRFDRGTANAATLLLASSSWLIFTSAEFMSHPLTAVLVALALLAFDRATEPGAKWGRWAVLAGVAGGALLLTRSFDAILVAAAVGLVALLENRLVRSWRALASAGVAAAAVGALIFPYNLAVTGRSTYPAHLAWADERYGPGVDVIGFGPKVGIDRWPNLDPLPGHGLPDVVLNLNKNLFMTNIDLFGWAFGSLPFVWLAVSGGGWTRRQSLLLILPAAYLAGYSLFWFSGGPDLGARYWYPLITTFAALSVHGARHLGVALERRGAVSHPDARVAAVLVAATIGAAVTMLPWRAVTKHYRYRGVGGEVRALAQSAAIHEALVFVRTSERADYQSAFVLNPPSFEHRGTIYALDAGPAANVAVVARFPGRTVWVIGRVPASADGAHPFAVIEGPLPPGTPPSRTTSSLLPDGPKEFPGDHAQQLEAGVEVMRFPDAADPFGLTRADFTDAVAVLRELDRSLRGKRQAVLIDFHRPELRDAVRAEAHHGVAEMRAEQDVDDFREAPVAESRDDRVILASRAVDVPRADDEVVALGRFGDEARDGHRVGVAIGHELDDVLALRNLHRMAHAGAVPAAALSQHLKPVGLAPLDRPIGRSAVDDDDFVDPGAIDLGRDDLNGFDLIQGEDGEREGWTGFHRSPGEVITCDLVGPGCHRL